MSEEMEWQPVRMKNFPDIAIHADTEAVVARCKRDAGKLFLGRIADTKCPSCGAREIEIHPGDCQKFDVPEGSVLCEQAIYTD